MARKIYAPLWCQFDSGYAGTQAHAMQCLAPCRASRHVQHTLQVRLGHRLQGGRNRRLVLQYQAAANRYRQNRRRMRRKMEPGVHVNLRHRRRAPGVQKKAVCSRCAQSGRQLLPAAMCRWLFFACVRRQRRRQNKCEDDRLHTLSRCTAISLQISV